MVYNQKLQKDKEKEFQIKRRFSKFENNKFKIEMF